MTHPRATRKMTLAKISRHFFVEWYKANGRDFPWRSKDLDPFHSLITEMLLRKTRAEAVAKLWPKFVASYPDASSVTRASKKKLVYQLKILGFGNQKAEALSLASKWLIENHDGTVPDNLDDLMRVPHVGAYAAGAVLCFGFHRRFEIVDVNVQRFFARYYGIEVKRDVRRNPVIRDIARKWLPRTGRRTEQHNYGLLDFAAEICKAVNPRCATCPVVQTCSWARTKPVDSKTNQNSDAVVTSISSRLFTGN